MTNRTVFTNNTTILKRIINENSVAHFRDLFIETNWELIFESEDANHAYDLTLKLYCLQYNTVFPIKEVSIKPKSFLSP